MQLNTIKILLNNFIILHQLKIYFNYDNSNSQYFSFKIFGNHFFISIDIVNKST